MTNNNNVPKFDPQTGEPLQKSEPKEKFDPQTGKPLNAEENTSSVKNNKINIDLKQIFNNIKSKKWFKPMTIVLVVVFVLFVACEIFAAFSKNKVILSSIKTALAISNNQSIDDEVLGISNFVNTYNKGDTKQTIEIGDDEGAISIEAKNKPRKNKSEVIAQLIRDEDDILADYYCYNDNEQTIFGFPEIYDDIFLYKKISDNTSYKNLTDSLTLFDIKNITENNDDGSIGVAAVALLSTVSHETATFVSSVFSKISLLDIYKQVQVEKSQPIQLNIGGKDVKCEGYTLTIPKVLISKYMDIAIKELDKNNFMGNIAELSNPNISESAKNDAKKKAEDVFESIKENAKDMDINIYIYKGKIAEVNYKININECEIKCKVNMTGKKNPADNAFFNVSIDNDGYEIETKFKVDTEYNRAEKTYTKDIALNINNNSAEVEISNSLSYNRESKELENKAALDTSLGEFPILDLDATVNEFKKGRKAEIEIHKLRFGSEDSDYVLEGSYSFEKGRQKFEPKKATVDVKDMSNKEIEKAAMKIKDKLYKNVSKIDDSIVGYYINSYYAF